MRFTSSDLLSPDMRARSAEPSSNDPKPNEEMLQVRARLLHYIYQNHVNRDTQRLRGMTLSMELVTD